MCPAIINKTAQERNVLSPRQPNQYVLTVGDIADGTGLNMDFTVFVERTRGDIEGALRRRVVGRDDCKLLWKMLEGGKRLRPLLCILSFRACGGADGGYENALDVATAVELGHCASLCHDDIVDRDLRRRNKPSLWVEEGISEALMAGHRAISLGLQISLTHGSEIAETFLEAWDRSLRGGLREVETRKGKKLTGSEYLDIIAEKTASLFSAAAKVGSQVAGASRELQKLMEEYGAAVGVAYQVADDLSELHKGKPGELSSLIGQSYKSETAASVQEFLNGEMKTAIEEAERLSRDERIPESEFKPFLSRVPMYFIGHLLK
jgi:geranylgeranyl pyrophosphate synthase